MKIYHKGLQESTIFRWLIGETEKFQQGKRERIAVVYKNVIFDFTDELERDLRHLQKCILWIKP